MVTPHPALRATFEAGVPEKVVRLFGVVKAKALGKEFLRQ
jgi:hypothetical protein